MCVGESIRLKGLYWIFAHSVALFPKSARHEQSIGFAEARWKIVAHVDIRIAKTFCFSLNERAPKGNILSELTPHHLWQAGIAGRTSGELIESVKCHSGASEKHRPYRILGGKLRDLRRKKIDALDDVVFGE